MLLLTQWNSSRCDGGGCPGQPGMASQFHYSSGESNKLQMGKAGTVWTGKSQLPVVFFLGHTSAQAVTLRFQRRLWQLPFKWNLQTNLFFQTDLHRSQLLFFMYQIRLSLDLITSLESIVPLGQADVSLPKIQPRPIYLKLAYLISWFKNASLIHLFMNSLYKNALKGRLFSKEKIPPFPIPTITKLKKKSGSMG